MDGSVLAGDGTGSVNVFDLIQQGWYATYPLMLFSTVLFGVVIERLFVLRRLAVANERVTSEVCDRLQKGDVDAASSLIAAQNNSPASRIYAALLPLIRTTGVEQIVEFGERRRLAESRTLRQNIWMLGTICASAPFIGLLGTVVGIIKSFHQMAVAGAGGFSVVAAGISEALVATALGLGVGILAVIFFNYLQVRVGSLETTLRVGLGRVLEAAQIGGVHGAR
ncbi:MAG: MotA/TolQ/ExbB proton channel family protein [Planctomycetota bacterium]